MSEQDRPETIAGALGRALARLRWQDKTAEERAEHCAAMGRASRDARTPEQRSEAARKAANARWANRVSRATENGGEE
jgi:RPA family protein